MHRNTIEALRGSIKKWEGVVAGTIKNEGQSNCPLCKLFWNKFCEGCPVSEHTGRMACEGSPYYSYWVMVDLQNIDARSEEAISTAQAELDFLKALLEKYAPVEYRMDEMKKEAESCQD